MAAGLAFAFDTFYFGTDISATFYTIETCPGKHLYRIKMQYAINIMNNIITRTNCTKKRRN